MTTTADDLREEVRRRYAERRPCGRGGGCGARDGGVAGTLAATAS